MRPCSPQVYRESPHSTHSSSWMEPLPGRERRHVWPRILTACLLLYSLLHALIAGVSDGAVSARYLDTAGVLNDDIFHA